MTTNNNNTYKATFFVIPSYIMDLPGLTLAYLKVYETIFQFWNSGKSCYLSDDAITARTGICRSQIYEAFSFFEKHNEMVRRRKGGRRFLVQPERTLELNCSETIPTSAPAVVDVRSSGFIASAPADHNNKNISKEDNNKTLVDSRKSTDDDKRYSFFHAFYKHYPNKQKPAVAYKAFCKHEISDDFVSMLIEDVNKRKETVWKGRHKSKIPHPATYLNSREWEGELYEAEKESKNESQYTYDIVRGI